MPTPIPAQLVQAPAYTADYVVTSTPGRRTRKAFKRKPVDQVPDIVGPNRILQVTDSTMISVIEYNTTTEELYVAFKGPNKTIWKYEYVPSSVFAALATSPSVGQTFNLMVKNQMKGEKIYPQEASASS